MLIYLCLTWLFFICRKIRLHPIFNSINIGWNYEYNSFSIHYVFSNSKELLVVFMVCMVILNSS